MDGFFETNKAAISEAIDRPFLNVVEKPSWVTPLLSTSGKINKVNVTFFVCPPSYCAHVAGADEVCCFLFFFCCCFFTYLFCLFSFIIFLIPFPTFQATQFALDMSLGMKNRQALAQEIEENKGALSFKVNGVTHKLEKGVTLFGSSSERAAKRK